MKSSRRIFLSLASVVALSSRARAQATAPAAPLVDAPKAAVTTMSAGAIPWSGRDTPAIVAAAMQDLPPLPPGPYQPTWDSIRAHFKTPEWFRDGKFGIMMHWGIFSVPAHQSEWYVRYMYGGNAGIMQWHTEHYGPPTKFGYKDFLPQYTAAKWDPDAWAALFKKAGAKYVLAPGEHHDGFSNWDSAINKYNSVHYGPHRDLDGDLIKALERAGLKTGVSNHSNPHFNFIPALAGSDEYDPAWADFYSVADRSNAARSKFLHQWLTKNIELIDKYHPDMLWFDMNGGDRSWDPLKLYLAAYYYNRGEEWHKQVTFSSKGESFLAGMTIDYEREGRAPQHRTDYTWQPDDPITDKFGYVIGQPVKPAPGIIRLLVTNVARNGNYLLNISPRADGTIPDEQQQVLLAIGHWLEINGEAIYSSRPWKMSEEGSVHFTTHGDVLYAITTQWPTGDLVIPALSTDQTGADKITQVELLGATQRVGFTQDAAGLHVQFPSEKPCDTAYTLKISGLHITPQPFTSIVPPGTTPSSPARRNGPPATMGVIPQ